MKSLQAFWLTNRRKEMLSFVFFKLPGPSPCVRPPFSRDWKPDVTFMDSEDSKLRIKYWLVK